MSRRSRAAAPLPVVVAGCPRPGGSAALVARALEVHAGAADLGDRRPPESSPVVHAGQRQGAGGADVGPKVDRLEVVGPEDAVGRVDVPPRDRPRKPRVGRQVEDRRRRLGREGLGEAPQPAPPARRTPPDRRVGAAARVERGARAAAAKSLRCVKNNQ